MVMRCWPVPDCRWQGTAGDAAAASDAYDALANDGTVDALYRDAALLLSVMNAPEDSDPLAQLDRLSSLANGNSSWQPLALELSAALHLKAGNEAEALSSWKPSLIWQKPLLNYVSVHRAL